MNEKTVKFSLSLLFFWIRGYVKVDSRMVRVSTRNTIWGIIPAGADTQNIPVKNISSSQITTKYKVIPLLLGAIFVLSAVSNLSSDFGVALLLIILGVLLFGSGIKTLLVIQRSGSDYYLSLPFYEKQKAFQIQDEIQEVIAIDADKGDLGLYFDKK